MTYILAIDQGTTSTRAILFDAAMTPVSVLKKNFHNIFRIQAGLNMTRATYGPRRP